MVTTLLYYPTFKIPAHEWLTDALLYWDQVGSIVPERMKKVLNTPNIRYLMDEDCYRRFEPAPAFGQIQGASTFEAELTNRLDSPAFAQALANDSGGQLWSVAFEKMTQQAWEILAARNLTADKHFTTSWLRVRRPAAIVYMGLLADRIAQSDENSYIKPSTDQELYEDLVFRGTDLATSLQAVSLKMQNLLPKAAPDTELRTLLEFKATRQDELAQFKSLISEYQVRIASCPDKQSAGLLLDDFKFKIESSSTTIQRLLAESRINSIIGTVRMIFISGGATWLADIGANALGAPPHDHTTAVICTSLGLVAGASIEFAAYRMDTNGRRQALKDSPCSYLYYASKEGIIVP